MLTKEIEDMPYEEFCQMLAKPGDVMDAEISKEENDILEYALFMRYSTTSLPLNYRSRREELIVKHMLAGIASELGEIIDVIKGLVIYRKSIHDIDKEGNRLDNSFLKEVGDLLFFFTEYSRIMNLESYLKIAITQQIQTLLDKFANTFAPTVGTDMFTIANCIRINKEKLCKRYHKLKYSNEQATQRADTNGIKN